MSVVRTTADGILNEKLVLKKAATSTSVLIGAGKGSGSELDTAVVGATFLDFRLSSSAASGVAAGLRVQVKFKTAGYGGVAIKGYAYGEAVGSGDIIGTSGWAEVHLASTGTMAANKAAIGVEAAISTVSGLTLSTTGSYYALELRSALASDPTSATCAFIHQIDTGTYHPKYFMIADNFDTTALFVAATNVTIDHALKVKINGTDYWIGLYDATTGS